MTLRVFLFQFSWEQGISLGMFHSFQFVLWFQQSGVGCSYLLTYSTAVFFPPVCSSGEKKRCFAGSVASQSLLLWCGESWGTARLPWCAWVCLLRRAAISSVHDDGFCDVHDFLCWEMNCEHLLIFHRPNYSAASALWIAYTSKRTSPGSFSAIVMK